MPGTIGSTAAAALTRSTMMVWRRLLSRLVRVFKIEDPEVQRFRLLGIIIGGLSSGDRPRASSLRSIRGLVFHTRLKNGL